MSLELHQIPGEPKGVYEVRDPVPDVPETIWSTIGPKLQQCDRIGFYRVRDGRWFGSVTVLSEIYTGSGRTQVEAIEAALDKAEQATKGDS